VVFLDVTARPVLARVSAQGSPQPSVRPSHVVQRDPEVLVAGRLLLRPSLNESWQFGSSCVCRVAPCGFLSDCLEFFQLQRAQVRLETLSEARKRLRASSIGSRDSPEPLLCESKVGYRVPLTVLTALTAPTLVTSHTPSTRLGRARHPIRASE
jgi:hypothetical protein